MKNRNIITILSICIALFATIASSVGIFSDGGPGKYTYQSIRGQAVEIYGHGIYKDMSADVAIQGIAQDYVTLFVCVPLLLISLVLVRRNSLRAHFLLAGVLNYFFVTYLFYISMAMYNYMFLAYAVLLSTSFFALVLTIMAIDIPRLPQQYSPRTPVKFIGSFMIFMTMMIGMLWLSIVVPPLMDGTVVPVAAEHYTTLIVQGFDLSLMLPIAFLSGFLLLKKNAYGFMMANITIIFLPLLMLALIAKIIAMAMNGVNVIPVIFIIPAIFTVSLVCAILLTRGINVKLKT